MHAQYGGYMINYSTHLMLRGRDVMIQFLSEDQVIPHAQKKVTQHCVNIVSYMDTKIVTYASLDEMEIIHIYDRTDDKRTYPLAHAFSKEKERVTPLGPIFIDPPSVTLF